MRFRKPAESCCHKRPCRKTRIVFMSRDSAHSSSRSIAGRSNESACHISNWLIAVLGIKLLPTRKGCRECQLFARCLVHGPSDAGHSSETANAKPANHRFALNLLDLKFLMRARIVPIGRSELSFLQQVHGKFCDRCRRETKAQHVLSDLDTLRLRRDHIILRECVVCVDIAVSEDRGTSRLDFCPSHHDLRLSPIAYVRVNYS